MIDVERPRVTVAFGEAFRYWVRLGFINFGGPAGQIAMLHRDLVERRRWISEERFLHALNFCMLLPGPEATQLAIYIGFLLHGTLGGIVAGAFFVLPSIFCLLGLSYAYAAWGNVAAVAGVLAGFKPVVVAIVVEAMLRIGRRALKRPVHGAIAAAAFVALYFFGVPFPAIVLAAGAIGLAVEAVSPGEMSAGQGLRGGLVSVKKGSDTNKFYAASAPGGGEQAPESVAEPPLPAIDDDTPTPPHARPSLGRAARTLAAGLLLWIAPFAAIVAWRGADGIHAEEYRFFTLAAFVTFGGAYAVLSYVTHAATTRLGWLTPAEAVDGLALAETTPGPLIMVLQFVGFVAAWHHPGGLAPATSAVVGALATTWAMFLPTFLFVFLGAPYIEALRGNRTLSAALSGVTAAVVGVILNLAVMFGATVLFPRGLAARPDAFALALAVVGFVALQRFKVDAAWVVLGGGLVGLASRWL